MSGNDLSKPKPDTDTLETCIYRHIRMHMCRKRKHNKIKLYQFEFKMQNTACFKLSFSQLFGKASLSSGQRLDVEVF